VNQQDLANLLQESSRTGAQQAMAQLQAENLLNKKAYISIDSPGSALALLGAISSAIVFILSLQTAPIETRVDRNEKDIETVQKEIGDNLKLITDHFMKKK
jgi:hypothetical protein